MPGFGNSVLTKRNLAILLIALIIALAILFARAERAAAQITAEEYQEAVTLERMLILGTLGLVVLTWYYLKWRPPPGAEDDERPEPDRD